MTLRDFFLVVLQALQGDKTARGTMARAITMACPLFIVTSGADDILVTIKPGPLLRSGYVLRLVIHKE